MKLMGRVWGTIRVQKFDDDRFPQAASAHRSGKYHYNWKMLEVGSIIMFGISRFTWNAYNDQLLAWVPLLLHTQRGMLKKDWPAEAICNGCRAESCSEARYVGDAAQEPILAKSRILFRIFFTPRKLNHGNLKFGKNTHMEVTNIKNPLVCLQNSPFPGLLISIGCMFKLRGANCKPTPWLVYLVPSRKAVTPAENHSVFE